MNQTTLSVVIPTYNRSEMLKRCVFSVLGPVTKDPDLAARVSVIVVDDGSTTSDAKEALRSLSKAFPSSLLKIVENNVNSNGAAKPRNIALNIIDSDYVFFVDSDDYLGSEAISRIMEILDRDAPDYLYPNSVNEGKRSDHSNKFSEIYVERNLRFAISSLVVRRVFRVAIIKRLGLRFDEYLRSGQDVPFAFEFIINANKFGFAGGYDYYHLVLHKSEHEDGHLSHKSGSDNFSPSLRVSFATYTLQKLLFSLSSSPVESKLQVDIAGSVILPRVLKSISAKLPKVENKYEQIGLFNYFKNIVCSPLMPKGYGEYLKPDHAELIREVIAGDLDKFLSSIKS